MIEQLFGSKTRVKLLQLFYQNPNRSFYVREITRKIDEQINSVRRELANLLSIGIITSENTNNRLYYEVNQDFEHYLALSSVFGGKKFKPTKKSTSNKELTDIPPKETTDTKDEALTVHDDPFVNDISKAGNVRLLIYTGQFTRDELTGVDILIVGDVNAVNVDNVIAELEAAEKKAIRYSILPPEDFRYRREVNDRFVSNVQQAKKIIHIDRDNYFN